MPSAPSRIHRPSAFARAPFALAGIAVALLAAVSARALTWETKERSLALDVGSAEVVVEFPYKNDSASAVTVTGVKSGCDCTVVDLPDRPVPAGAKGILKVRYTPGALPGEKTVPVEIATDETGVPPAVLTLKVAVSPAVSITPVLLRWPRDAAATAREVVIRGAPNRTLTALTLEPAPASLAASLKPGKEPGTWILSVTPVSTREELTARLQLRAEVDGRTLANSVYAIVR